MKPKLLIVDDEEEIRTQMQWALSSEYTIAVAGDRRAAMEQFRIHRPPVVLLDLGLPPHTDSPEEGLAALAELLEFDRTAKIIIVTGQSEKEPALRAIGSGAFDFVGKPCDMNELRIVLKRSFHVARLEQEYREMQRLLQTDSFEGMVGNGPRMQAVFATIRKIATADIPVLILGESGTGKEMTARAIHQQSTRRDGPFVAINCSAIPESLIETELFGHEKGVFTGAHAQRKGRIEMSAGGTLFLDEIGEVPPPIQVKLLRFLQEQTIERVGGREQITVDARVIAATNADLNKTMAAGGFREDLFYRLAGLQITLPPLRERHEDVEVLARWFLQRFAAESQRPELTFSPEALRAIRQHEWKGNVRELQNRVRRAVVMSEGKSLTIADLELPPTEAGAASSLKQARESLERDMVQRSLRRHSGCVSAAAVELGVSRPTLYELMSKLHVARHG